MRCMVEEASATAGVGGSPPPAQRGPLPSRRPGEEMSSPIIILDEIDSTNAEARRRAEAGEAGPVWIVARRQTAGRGRRGRTWGSDEGNLFATLLMVTPKPPAQAAQVTFVAALAVADLVEAFSVPGRMSIKWPNDVMLGGEKAAGILVESGPHAAGGLWLAVGIGVNLGHHPEGTERPATSVRAHLRPDVAHPPAPEVAIRALADGFDQWLTRWDTLGFDPLLEAWRARAGNLHGPVTARLGRETIEGVADGVEADGSLRLRLPDGSMRLIAAGDIFFGETA